MRLGKLRTSSCFLSAFTIFVRMKRPVFLLLFGIWMSSALGQKEQSIVVSDKLQTLRCGDLIVPVRVGTTDTAMYYPRLAGKRVTLLANHTSMIGERHLIDILHARGFDVTAIFAPEHGFRGTADPGEHMGGATGTRGGLPTRRCTRSRWREQVGCGRVIPKLYRAIGCLRRFRAGSHWSGSAQSQQNAHRRTDSRRTIRGGGGICVPDDCRGICCGGDPQPVAGGYRVVPYSKKAISFIRRATFIPFYS